MTTSEDGMVTSSGQSSITKLSRTPLLLAIIGALCAMSFAAVNGYAIAFIDTRSYIHGAGLATKFATGKDYVAEWKSVAPTAPHSGAPSLLKQRAAAFKNNGITANRSIYYGFLLLFGYLTSNFWVTIFIQSFIIAALIAIIFLKCIPRVSSVVYVGAMLAVGLLTSLGPYISYLMPDLFTGAMVMAVAILSTQWSRISATERSYCGMVIFLALLFHQSNTVILFGSVATIAIWHLARRTIKFHGKFYLSILICFVMGVLGQEAFSYGLERATGSRPLILPHLMAHLIDMGPGYQYIRASCPQSRFAVCKFEDRLPIYWEDFVGLADPKRGIFAPADLPTKRALSSEQIAFVWQVLRFDPAGVVLGLARDGARQIVAFSPTGLRYVPGELDYFSRYFPADVSRHIKRSAVGTGNGLLQAVGVSNLILVLGASVLILLFGIRLARSADRSESDARLAGLVAVLLSGVVVNALVCGMLASPLDRYQGRVVWIVPLAALIIVLWSWGDVRSRVRAARLMLANIRVARPAMSLRRSARRS